MINREDIKKLIEAHGVEETLDICFEECGELIQAISKAKRLQRAGKRLNYHNLLSEMADILIIIEMVKEHFNLADEIVDRMINIKMERNLERIETCSSAVSTAKRELTPVTIVVESMRLTK